MAPKLTNKISAKDLRPGDRIYAYRKMTAYSHHGIFVGENTVIHFHTTQEGNTSRGGKRCRNCNLVKDDFRGVVKSCLKCFLDGHHLRRFRYGVSPGFYIISKPGTCTTGDAPCPVETVNRANGLFDRNDFGVYHITDNNCETFAVFCTTGKRWSDQGESAKSLLTMVLQRLWRDVKRSSHHDKKKFRVFKQAMEKFFHDESILDSEENIKELNQMIDSWETKRPSPEEIIDDIGRRLKRSLTI